MSVLVERLLAFGTEASAALRSSLTVPTIAHGWATVDLDRAAEELGLALGLPPERFVIAPDTRLLGARCRVADAVLPDGSSLAVLEPATEGRLAATLARVGEGPAAVWLVAADGRGPGAATLDPAAPFSAQHDGPFGLERLVLGGAVHGPHRLVVAPPGTIRP
jgi:hypothetical protein